MKDVLCYSENSELADEAATAGEELAQTLGANAFSIEFGEVRNSRKSGGKVILVKSDREVNGSPELVSKVLVGLAQQRQASAILIGTSRLGREVASRLAVGLRRGSLVEVGGLKVENGRLVGVRNVYAGKFQATVSSPLPCIALLRQGAYPRKERPVTSIEETTLSVPEPKVRNLGERPRVKSTVDLRNASVIVSAGRGVKKKEDLELIERLANAVGGVVGCSRPLSSDMGWLGEEHHIGLTGAYVHPELYVAVGISGQLQHVAGIKESKVIVAINNDKQAPIFQVADYGVVGDLYAVIPAMLKMLEGNAT